jgi:penicillin-binding protein 1A
VLKNIGVNHAVSYAKRLGIESPLSNDLSLALGSSVLSLMEITRAYSTFATMGLRPEPIFITKVVDRNGNVLEENTPSSEKVLSHQTSYIMTNLLQGVVENGTGWRAKALKRPVAGKTGTTNNLNDAWFIGFVPGLAAGVWVGYDSENPLGEKETGSRTASPIWVKFMKQAIKGTPPKNFPIPDGVEFAKIDPETGLLAGPSTENPIFEVFKVGTAPTDVSVSEELQPSLDFFMLDSDEKPLSEEEPEFSDPSEEDLI